MGGHSHNPTAGTQNQGNSLGDRSCVRQSKLYRMYESGNDVKSILGTSHLCWDSNQKQGAYQGQQVYDHTMDDPLGVNKAFSNPENYSRRHQDPSNGHDKRSDGRGVGNFLSGYTDGRNTDYSRGGVAGKSERRQSYDREPQEQDNRRAARGSFANDENNYRDKNYSNSGYDERSYPSKQRGGEDRGYGYNDRSNERGYDNNRSNGSDDRYRNMRGDMENSLSNYQSKKADAVPQERSAVRVFKQDKSTRPW